MTRFLLSLGLGVIVCDILGVFGQALPHLPWIKWLPILSLVVFPVFVLYLLRRGIASAARDLSTSYDRFALVALASWILANFWGLFMSFPEPQRWGVWLAMVLLVWRVVEVLSQKVHEASNQAQLAAEARGLALRSRLPRTSSSTAWRPSRPSSGGIPKEPRTRSTIWRPCSGSWWRWWT